jgi:[acyl-carrier-protein] S-malonyltransferase
MAEYTPTFLGSVLKAIACTPNKNFDQQAYEAGVLEPARRIRKLWDELGEQRPSDEQIREVMQLLLQIFETKMVDVEERDDRIRDILDRHQLHPLFPELLPLQT